MRHTCGKCGDRIDEERVANGKRQGIDVRFCSDACADAARAAAYYEANREKIAARRKRRRMAAAGK